MENFLFSVQATIPVFVVILAGWCLRRLNILNDGFVNAADRFCFQVAIPILLFQDISGTEMADLLDWHFIGFCFMATTVCFGGIWLISRLVMKDKSLVGAFVQGSFRGSAAILGIAFVVNMYGESGMAPIMVAITVPLYNIYSVLVLTLESNGEAHKSWRQVAVNIAKNHIIWGILAGLLFVWQGWHFPALVEKSLDNFAVMATPLALLSIGAAFEGKKALTKMKPTLWATAIKLVLQPLVFLPLAVWFGFRDQALVAILIMLAAPTTMTSYIMAKNMNNDAVLTSSIVVTTMLISSITITIWIFLLKSFALI